MMIMLPGLIKRGGRYIYRRSVPEKLRPLIGRREWKVSLGTADLSLAQRKLPAVAARVEQELQEAERGVKSPTATAYKLLKDGGFSGDWEGAIGDMLEEDASEERNARRLQPSQREVFKALLQYRQAESTAAEDNPPLSVLWTQWRHEANPLPRTWSEWNLALQRLTDVSGDVPVRSLTTARVRTVKERLLSTKSSRGGGQRMLAPSSVKKSVGAIHTVLAWALRQGYVEKNVAAGMAHESRKDRDDLGRLPFTDQEARLLLDRAVDDLPARDRWLVWMAAYTGARLAELCGLRPEDILTDRFLIRPHERRGLKTKSSRREVPRHAALAGLQWAGPCASSAASKRLNRWLQGIIPGRVVHEWRHTLVSKLRAANVPADHARQILGHAKADVHQKYGAAYPVEVLREAIAKVVY